MDEGRQDATIMVAYLPQKENAGREYADNIFDEIEKYNAKTANTSESPVLQTNCTKTRPKDTNRLCLELKMERH